MGMVNHIPQASVIGKLTPVAGAALGGFYSWRLLEDVGISHSPYLVQHVSI